MLNVIIIGSSGMLGKAVHARFPEAVCVPRKRFNTHGEWWRDSPAMVTCVAKLDQPTVVLHCAGLNREKSEIVGRVGAMRSNVYGTYNVFDFCDYMDASLVYFSTEYVFDGTRGNYRPTDKPNPVNYYGETKLAGEIITLSKPSNMVIRVSAMPEPFPYRMAFTDVFSSRLPIDQAALKIEQLVRQRSQGIHHVCGPRQSLYDYALSRRVDAIPKEADSIFFRDVVKPMDTSLLES